MMISFCDEFQKFSLFKKFGIIICLGASSAMLCLV